MAAVDEADIGAVKPGQHARFTVDAFPERPFDAEIRDISYASVTTDGVVTYNARLEVDNNELLLRPGMTATVSVVTKQAKGVLTVPATAFRYRPAQQAAARLEPAATCSPAAWAGPAAIASARPRQRRPTARARSTCWRTAVRSRSTSRSASTDGELTEIISGLDAGAQVITASQQRSRYRGCGRAAHHLRQGLEELWPGRGQGACAGRRRPCHPARRIRRHHGPVRLRQVDGDEHHRLPRHADGRRPTLFEGIDAGRPRPQPPRAAAQPLCRLRLPGLQPAAAHHGGRECRTAADLSRRGRRRAARRAPCRRWRRSALPAASTTRRPNCPAASSSAWRSRAPSSQPDVLLADEPTGNLDTAAQPRDHGAADRAQHRAGITVVMVTHEADIAAYAERTVRFLDGHVASDAPRAVEAAP